MSVTLNTITKIVADAGFEYTQQGDCLLVLGDCLKVLPLLLEGCVDAVIVDPVWPNAPDGMFPGIVPAEIFARAMAMLPNAVKRIAVQIGCNSDPRFLTGVPQRWPFFRACWLEYVRPAYLGRLLYTSDVGYLFGEPPPSRQGNGVISGKCLMVNSKREPCEHPCPRQPFHVEWLVGKWTSENETILDPFAGSFTTAIACIRTGRACIAIELERKYYDIGVARVRKEYERLSLLEPPPEVLTQGELL